jgi:hypothetical protein
MNDPRTKVINFLTAKIESGEETEITKHQVENIPLTFSDLDGKPGGLMLPHYILNNMSETTLKELELLLSSGL